jgi:hypothetical protein
MNRTVAAVIADFQLNYFGGFDPFEFCFSA